MISKLHIQLHNHTCNPLEDKLNMKKPVVLQMPYGHLTCRIPSGKVCGHCGKVLKDSTDLARHERTHTGARPYRCIICNKLMSLKGNLRKHITRKHGIIDEDPNHFIEEVDLNLKLNFRSSKVELG